MNDYRLSEKELTCLRVEHKRMKGLATAKAADRIKAVYLSGSGWGLPTICEALLIDENTVYRYFSLYKNGGLEELLRNNYKGTEHQLTAAEMDDLDCYLYAKRNFV